MHLGRQNASNLPPDCDNDYGDGDCIGDADYDDDDDDDKGDDDDDDSLCSWMQKK